MQPPPPLPVDSIYTKCYCEENVYLLCEAFSKDMNLLASWEPFVLFISNDNKTVALWEQKASWEEGYPVVWDYHVILVLCPRTRTTLSNAADIDNGMDGGWTLTSATDSESDSDRQGWVYDFDTTLPNPCPTAVYFRETFLEGVVPDFSSRFRVVRGAQFLDCFASDRSHMIRKDMSWSSPPPGYPPICGHLAGVSNNLMSRFVDMHDDKYGLVLSRENVLPFLEGIVSRFLGSTVSSFSAIAISTSTMSSAASTSGSVNGRVPTSNGSAHGEKTIDSAYETNGVSSPSSSSFPGNGFTRPPFPNAHNEEIIDHLYQAGFQTGHYADTNLHVHQHVYRLHAIILSRSPYLAHLMSTSPQSSAPHTIYVNLEQEPEVTQEGFAIALGYLYSAVSLTLVRPENARAVLAAACLLGGMDDLSQYAYTACRQSISVDTINAWLDFVDALPAGDGSATPATSVFGQYAQRLRNDVFHFLVVTLPEVLEVQGTGGGRDTLLNIYARVPFELFKSAVESPTFVIGSDQARFKFAKEAIELRKRGIARGGEETVVLAFGQGSGGSVHITRKMRRRNLFKV